MKSGLRRLTARCATAVLAATFAFSGTTAAQAWTFGQQIGTAVVGPVSGLDTDAPSITTSGVCPDTSTSAQIFMRGAGFDAAGWPVTPLYATSLLFVNQQGGYDAVPFQDQLQSFAAQQTPPATFVGTYTIDLVCKTKPLGGRDDGDFRTTITFTDPHHYTSGATATTTTLTASPAATATSGSPVTLTASVTPAGAAGSVQFLDGTAVLGTAAVSGTSATLTTSTLTIGTHSLTAVFTPTAPAGASPSTSAAVAYTITVKAPVVSSPSALVLGVDTVITCPGGHKLALPASQVGNAIYCQAGGPYVVVEKGGILKPLVAPVLSGSGKVGSKLSLTPGLWNPVATSKTVTWKRDGKVIAKAAGLTYLVKKTDKGHKISATVTAHRAGWVNGVASTSALKANAVSAAPFGVPASPFAATAGVPGDSTPLGVPVGSAIGCVAAEFTGASAPTAAWLLDGAAYKSTPVIIIGDSLAGHVLTCRTTATNAGGTTTSDAVVAVGKGAALVAYVKPHISGVAKVGKKLSVVAGKWLPTFTKVTYQWLKDGKVIKGATKPTFVLPSADRHHKITVKLTGTRVGWLPGVATAAAVSVG